MNHYQTEKETDRLWLKEEFSPEFELKTESIFSQCNGYMGVRAAHPFLLIEEQRGMFLSGAFHKAYEEEVTELVNCPDVTWFELEVAGEKIYPERSCMLSCSRKIDLLSGELAIKYVFEARTNAKIQVECRRFASMENKHLFAQYFRVKILEGNVENLKIKTGINGQKTNSGVSHFHSVMARVYEKEVMEIRSELQNNTITLAGNCTVISGCLKKKEFSLGRRKIHGVYQIVPDENGEVLVEKMIYADQTEDEIGTDDRKKILHNAGARGYAVLFEEHRKIMQQYWEKAAIKIDGMTEEEEAEVYFAQYHILGMTPWHTNESSIAAKGLTGEGYKGHVFWDAEVFVFPSLLFTYPEAGKRLLQFRYKGLDGARKKAKYYGFEGAMFPWEAAKTGEEETPLYAALNIHTGKANKVWSGMKEYHVTADIIYAVEQYYQVTGDQEFMDECGYEMTFEAAKFWVSCSEWDEKRGKYTICDVIGPDEYTEHVDNNAYTNYMAAYCMKMAGQYAKSLKEERPELYASLNRKLNLEKELPRWEEFQVNMYLPSPNEDAIIPQDDTFLSKPCLENIEKYKTAQIKQSVLLDYSREEVVGMQVLKQADVVMLLNLFPQLFGNDVVRKNVIFYEGKTIHDSSLSYCAHAQACAMIGAMDLAWKFFQYCLAIDVDDNPNDSTDGIHSASLGGIWNCLIFGFAGVHYEDGNLYLNPHLPEQWKKMEFSLVISGQQIHFQIAREYIRLKSKEPMGNAMRVRVKDIEYIFENELEITM